MGWMEGEDDGRVVGLDVGVLFIWKFIEEAPFSMKKLSNEFVFRAQTNNYHPFHCRLLTW